MNTYQNTKHYRSSDLQGQHFNKPAAAVPITTGYSSAVAFNQLLTTSDSYALVLKRHFDQHLYTTELYARDKTDSDAALGHPVNLTVMKELEIEPTIENSLTGRKAPDSNGITAEVLKCGKPVPQHRLHRLHCLCWKEGDDPQDIRDANIATFYKKKGDGATATTTMLSFYLVSLVSS